MIYDKKLVKYAVEYIEYSNLNNQFYFSHYDYLDGGVDFLTTTDDIIENTAEKDKEELATEYGEKARSAFVKLFKYYCRKYNKTAYNSLKQQTCNGMNDIEEIYYILSVIDRDHDRRKVLRFNHSYRDFDLIKLDELLSKLAKNLVLYELDELD